MDKSEFLPSNELPTEWKIVPFAEIAQSRGGFGFPLDNQGNKEGDYPFYKVSDMNLVGNEKYMQQANNWIDRETLTKLKAKTYPARATIFPKIGAAVFTNKKRLLTRDSVIDNNVMAVVSRNEDRCLPEFIYHWFQTIDLGRLANPGALPSINSGRLSEIPFTLPPIREQERISKVLSTVESALEQQARMIALTRELKSALMKKLFTEGLRGEKQKETEIGLVPESWAVESLSSLFTIKHGFGFKSEHFKSEGKYILLTPGHFNEKGGFRDQKEKTKFYTGKIPDGFILQKGDLLIAMTEQKAGLLGSSIIIPESDKYVHNQRLGLIQNLDSCLDKDFLFYYFNTSYPRREIFSTATGSKVRHTSPSKVLNLKIAFPQIEEQKQIAKVLKVIDQRFILANEKKLLLEELFRTLLHQLMTGQVRVKNLEI